MSDSRTVSTLLYLQELQEKAERGFVDFAEATREQYDNCICFDRDAPLDIKSICASDGEHTYAAVGMAVIDEMHHHLISYASEQIDGTVYVCEKEDGGFFVGVDQLFPDDHPIDIYFDGEHWREIY